MDSFLEILFNLSPIITILYLCVCFKLFLDSQSKLSEILFYLFYFLSFVFAYSCKHGYGNIILVIITLSISVLMWVFLLIISVVDIFDYPLSCVCYLIFSITNIAMDLYYIYIRLKLNHVLEIRCIDKMIYNLENIDILNNDWFQGISIGVISAVLGGMILNKISKK